MHRLKGLAQFEGEWRLERRIDDREGGVEGRLEGTATFSQTQPGELSYVETGALTYGTHPAMTAERRYTWRDAPEHHRIDVFFDDGRAFHSIELDRLMPDDNHYCDPDFYHVSYDFTAWPTWLAIWRVVGPKKNYRMMSTYTRQDG